jgi:hypothetical protein
MQFCCRRYLDSRSVKIYAARSAISPWVSGIDGIGCFGSTICAMIEPAL